MNLILLLALFTFTSNDVDTLKSDTLTTLTYRIENMTRRDYNRLTAYPFVARNYGIEGTIFYKVRIDSMGKPISITSLYMIESQYHVLYEHGYNIIRHFRFDVRNKVYIIPIRYQLRNSFINTQDPVNIGN